MKTYYKLARPDGWDFHTGKTINYRQGIGSIVTAPDWRGHKQCGGGLHICADPNDCFIGASIPCSAYEVEPVGQVSRIDRQKVKARALRVVREITDLDGLFGWRYSEAVSPVNPLALPAVQNVTPAQLELLRQWAAVGVWDSVWDSMRDSMRDSVLDSVWDSVWNSVWDSVWDSVRDSAWKSVGDSVGYSVYAYIGSLFPGIRRWKHIKHSPGEYPYAPGAALWRQGLVPSYDGRIWRLHTGGDARIVWTGSVV